MNDKLKEAEEYLKKANLAIENYSWAKGIEYYTKAIELGLSSLEIFEKRADAFSSLKDFQNAISDYTECIYRNPKRIYYYRRGECNNALGNYDNAIVDFSQAMRLDKSRLCFDYYNRGLAYFGKKKYRMAISDFNKSLHNYSPLLYFHVETYYAIARAYMGMKKYIRAIEYFNRGANKRIELSRDSKYGYHPDTDVYVDWGICYLRVRDLNKAIGKFTEYIQKKLYKVEVQEAQQIAIAYFNRGLAYENQRKYDLAIGDFKQAILINSDYEEAINALERIKKNI